MYRTCLPTYLRTYVPIMYDSSLYWLLNYLLRSSNLLMYLQTYVHTYVTTYVPTYLCTYVPISSTYHQRTYVPKLSTYLLTYIHTYFTTYVTTSQCTYIPILSTYHQRTYVPKLLSTCILIYVHIYLSTILIYIGSWVWAHSLKIHICDRW
jgi:hypothetical protein